MPSQYAKLRFWRNTAVASLQPGQTATLAPETLGYEWDEDVDNGFRPAGTHRHVVDDRDRPRRSWTDYQEDLAAAHRHAPPDPVPGGQRSAGVRRRHRPVGLGAELATTTETPRTRPSPTMQQATVNVLADMGAQPTTLMSGLVAGHGVHRHHAAHVHDHVARVRARA